MDAYDTQAIFTQLAREPAEGVKTVIENHDAWGHNDAVLVGLNTVGQARMLAMRQHATGARIAGQRRRLEPLVTRLSVRYASAG